MPRGETPVGVGLSLEDRALIVSLRQGQAAILAELNRLRGLLERRGAPHDPARDARLIRAIAVALGGRVFNVGELLALAQMDRELRGALEAIGMRDARGLGSVLRRLRGRPLAGYLLEASGRDHHGMIWGLTVSDLHTGSCASLTDPAG